MRAITAVGFAAFCYACFFSSVNAQSLTWLGRLGGSFSRANGVSNDGSVVVGTTDSPNGIRAFRWTPATGMQSLGVLASGESFGIALSSDGAVIVGLSDAPNWRRIAFRWTASSGMQPVFNDNPYNSGAVDVSANGDSIAVNLRYFDGSAFVDFSIFTTPGGDYTLNPPVGNALSAVECSADGTTVVGSMTIYPTLSAIRRAFRWTAQGGIQNLGALTNAAFANSEAYCVSADGSIVYGLSEQGSGGSHVMFRWTPTEGMTSTGAAMTPADTTADGTVVVGTDSAGRPVRWTQAGGMEDLNVTYASLIRSGWRLASATAISSDGRYIVGIGRNTDETQSEAFLLDTGCGVHNGDVTLDGCVDDADLLAVLFAFGASGSNLGRVDVNCDGVVDDADLLQVLFNFGQGC